MSGVREWAVVICMSVLAAALIQYFSPGGSMEKMLRLILGAFFICAFLFPLGNTLPQMALEVQASAEPAQIPEEFAEEVDRQREEAVKSSLTSLVVKELFQIGINCENVVCNMDTNEDGSIVINKVVVTLPTEYKDRCEEVSTRLEKTLGMETEVTADGG